MSAFVRRTPGARAAGPISGGAAADTGTRPGLHGQTLVSTGAADLDRLLGGGLPLGSVLLLLEDAASRQHVQVIKHFLAEGLARGHSLCWLAPRGIPGGAGAFLPSVATERERGSSGGGGGSASGGGGSSSAGSGSGVASASATASGTAPSTAAGTDGGDDGLRIAWQYRKYIQKQQQVQVQQVQQAPASARPSAFSRAGATAASSSAAAAPLRAAPAKAGAAASGAASAAGAKALEAGVAREWCHRFDASRPVGADAAAAAAAAGRLQHRFEWGPRPLDEAGAAAGAFAERMRPPTAPAAAAPGGAPPLQLPVRDPARVGRLVVESFGAAGWLGADDGDAWTDGDDGGGECNGGPGPAAEAALLRAVARLRLALQDASCAAVVTCPAALLSEACAARLRHLCDAVLALEALADDADVARLVPDPGSAAAVLRVLRLPASALSRPRPVDEAVFVVRASRRRGLALTAFEVDPDAEQRAAAAAAQRQQKQQTAGSGGAGGKPAAALLCATPAGASSALDF